MTLIAKKKRKEIFFDYSMLQKLEIFFLKEENWCTRAKYLFFPSLFQCFITKG